MTMIRPATSDDEDRIAELSLQAWEPVFASMAATLGQPIFRQLFGADWRRYQEADVRRACSAYQVWVAVTGEEVAGFTALHFPEDEPHGEIYMLAVHPQHQRQGIGADLTRFAVDQIRAKEARTAGDEVWRGHGVPRVRAAGRRPAGAR